MSTSSRRLSLFVLFVLLSSASFACGGGSVVRGRAVDESSSVRFESEEISAIDDRLAALEQSTEALRQSVDGLQGRVAAKMGVEDSLEFKLDLEGGTTQIEFDKNSVMRFNGVALSKSEVQQYAQSKGKSLCQPEPVVIVHPQANYDTVAWLLDVIYAQGCAGVDIVETPRDR
ncbi:MAG: hypothetical protein AUK47_23105 [Deltaproteobacteria bacterium CG2_30_63_29]|nr:MAG: hypothetical protein AUK47_23105 [Deltaproteobacteria bacterium CG2_30_63_29]PJB34821.1 MAG: hypothetical protein CO108_27255 [Deltaproteobacteria bacterium CG_4_9_14_3_um_filter_63_12]